MSANAVPTLTITKWTIDGRATVTRIVPSSQEQTSKMIAFYSKMTKMIVKTRSGYAFIIVSRAVKNAWF